MSRKQKRRGTDAPLAKPFRARGLARLGSKRKFALAVALIGFVGVSLAFALRSPAKRPAAEVSLRQSALAAQGKTPLSAAAPTPSTLGELLSLTPAQLDGADIGRMSFLCAAGLPGSQNLDIPKELAMLDEWAELVKMETREKRHLFTQNPKEYDYSEAHFKLFMLVEVLQTMCGIHYDPDWKTISSNRVAKADRYASYVDSRNIFLHGLTERRMGTCANLAVLYVAVGRRCGYPLFLVRAKSHFFARWEDGAARMNCEGTNRGLVEPLRRPDEHYRHWPKPISDEEMRDGYYLQNMTAVATLAEFLQIRADAIGVSGDPPGAAWELLIHCNELVPQFNMYRVRMAENAQKVAVELDRQRRRFPYVVSDAQQRSRGDPASISAAMHLCDQQEMYLEALLERMKNPILPPIVFQPKG